MSKPYQGDSNKPNIPGLTGINKVPLSAITSPGGGTGVHGRGVTGVQGSGDTGVSGMAIGDYLAPPPGNDTTGSGGSFAGYSNQAGEGIGMGSDGIDCGGGNGFGNSAGSGIVSWGGNAIYPGESSWDGNGGSFIGGSGAPSGDQIYGFGDGVYGRAGSGYAGNFRGDVNITGTLMASAKLFRIDHPLDQENQFLVHASVESSEMLNIYSGNAVTDGEGRATVQLPAWFEAINTDFRYQLTVIGKFAQAIVSRKVENGRFEIQTSEPGVEVSWQITAARQDAYAKAQPLVVEQKKEGRLRGFYLHPELHGAAAEKHIEEARHPGMSARVKRLREAMDELRRKAKAEPSE